MNDKEKVKKLKESINDFVEDTLTLLDQEGKVDYFTLEISNHNGNLNFQYKVKEIKKAY